MLKKFLEILTFQKRHLEKLPKDRNILGLDDLISPEEYAIIDKEHSRLLSPDQIDRRLRLEEPQNWFTKFSSFIEHKFEKYRPYITMFIIVFLFLWIILNFPGIAEWLTSHGINGPIMRTLEFDPFPYNGLSVLLSFIGAILSNLVLVAQRAAEKREQKKSDIDLELNQEQSLQMEAIADRLKEVREDLNAIAASQASMIGALKLLATTTTDTNQMMHKDVIEITKSIDQLIHTTGDTNRTLHEDVSRIITVTESLVEQNKNLHTDVNMIIMKLQGHIDQVDEEFVKMYKNSLTASLVSTDNSKSS